MRLAPFALPLLLATVTATAQAPMPVSGIADPSRVAAGTYQADSAHTQVAWSVNHLGFNAFHGLIGGATGTLTIDPARLADAAVSITIPVKRVVTTSTALDKHLLSPDFFDAATFPTATFRSTGVMVDGTRAKITGVLTLRGVTRPVTLDARFVGAGANPMSKAQTVGFEATTTIRRSDFGIRFGVPAVSDEVPLAITVAFEKA
ncbi:YceI family protein [Sphingomonas flavalba]|uniref:YceI family protein n=1 Tax=Sphingomonas flavalba TaxID=2559804 RepID=UPI0039E065E1